MDVGTHSSAYQGKFRFFQMWLEAATADQAKQIYVGTNKYDS